MNGDSLMNRVKRCGITHPKPYLDSMKGQVVRQQIDSYIEKKIKEWNQSVPYANHLYEKDVDKSYYRRHVIEDVWRIRLMRTCQTRVLHQIAQKSPEAAQLYARYQDEEMLHDLLFKKDVESLDVSEEELLSTEPMFSTRLLVGFIYFVVKHENPLGAIAYSYLIEYVTEKLATKRVENLAAEFGIEKVKGQAAHTNTDLTLDHAGNMWEILNAFIFCQEDIDAFYKYLDEIQDLLAMYFKELYELTIVKKDEKAT